MKVACVVVLLLAVFSAVVQARDHNEACFELLLAKYEASQNERSIPFLMQVVNNKTVVALPMGLGNSVQGLTNIEAFFTGFFNNFKSIQEDVHNYVVTGSQAFTFKTFSAVAPNGCNIAVSVIQDFVFTKCDSFDFIGAAWNVTDFGQQYNCK